MVDVGIRGDRIAASATSRGAQARTSIDATGLAVAPGFINMLSWATESLLADGRSQGDIRQGVTLEIFGEGSSMGPLNDAMKKRIVEEMGDIKYEITWTTLVGVSARAGAPRRLDQRRVVHRRDDDPRARDRTRGQEADAGAARPRCARWCGRRWKPARSASARSLIYAPAFYASTEELIELCKVAAQYQGKYISHMRSEGNRLVEAVDELIRISREAKIPAEIYHLKAAGKANWQKMDAVIAMVEKARADGLEDHGRHVHLPRRRDRASTPRCRRGCSTAATSRRSSD